MNLSDVPCTLCQGTRISDMYPLTSLKQAREVIQVNPQLTPDWDAHSESEEEELLNVCTADAAGLSGKPSLFNMQTNAALNGRAS